MRKLIFLLVFLHSTVFGQIRQDRLNGLLIGQGAVFAGTIYGLSKAWYKKPLKNFHTFNDNKEWLQLDKAGHAYTAYQIARMGMAAYQWAGMNNQQAALYGATSGVTFMLPIEILDGFSPEYGFSIGDVVANLTGPAILVTQQLAWGEVRVTPKWSFHPTRLARERPELLGRSWSESWLKDYNGQTYWLSMNPASFQAPDERTVRWPKLLNIAVGYGIDNMIAADYEKSIALGRRPVRQFFISPDLDLTRIPTHSDLLKSLLFLANCLKIPAPAIEFRMSKVPPKFKVKVHPVYF
ncbi:DUF2279 domain-containing protein [Siphonobacter sp. BAB-5385]|uniref:DUF2279 domain-containing protein n=1 Tax=Siphonobacter sp. BAB-5385 TaxID=1864822 RepID=UPI000B9E48FF|nr:DUF2279 domain-containing protein [Siphonobacter sp. BAB-5385]OZI06983.1 DUF2279 domain-containing protein [Siphonobacter sp. BAB-5385]